MESNFDKEQILPKHPSVKISFFRKPKFAVLNKLCVDIPAGAVDVQLTEIPSAPLSESNPHFSKWLDLKPTGRIIPSSNNSSRFLEIKGQVRLMFMLEALVIFFHNRYMCNSSSQDHLQAERKMLLKMNFQKMG